MVEGIDWRYANLKVLKVVAYVQPESEREARLGRVIESVESWARSSTIDAVSLYALLKNTAASLFRRSGVLNEEKKLKEARPTSPKEDRPAATSEENAEVA